MVIINDIQVLLVPMELRCDRILSASLGYISARTGSIVWDVMDDEYFVSSFTLQRLKELYDRNT